MNRSLFRGIRGASAAFSVGLAVAVAPACATQSIAGDVPRVTAGAEARGTPLPLWQVSHEAGTLYLLGSVHLLRPEVYPLHERIYEAFDASNVVAFELDFDEMMAAAPLMIERGTFNDGRSLSDVLPVDLRDQVEERVTGLGIPMEAVESLRPWMLGLTLSGVALQGSGFDAASGIDLHFHERAKEAGREIFGLETVEEQLDVFAGLGEEAQVASLRATLEQLDDVAAQLDAATALWQTGDTEGLGAMFIEAMEEQAELMERLLYARNRNWIRPIEALLERGDTAIVIVGVGHLVGAGSVVELLEQSGHEVTQLRTAVSPAEAPAGVGGR
jgi:uncharacterized protein